MLSKDLNHSQRRSHETRYIDSYRLVPCHSPDENKIAFDIVNKATNGKNPAAMALGSLGGKQGSKRAQTLGKERMREIAKKAIKARWKGHKKKG